MAFQELAQDFLAQGRRIAVVGASSRKTATGNGVYTFLRDKGYTVFPVHPSANMIEGDPAYPSLQAIPGGVDGAFIATSSAVSEQVVRDAVEAGIPRVWLHYNALFGKGNSSVSEPAVAYGREHGVTVIDGGCPMMMLEPFHKCMRWVLNLAGKLPQ